MKRPYLDKYQREVIKRCPDSYTTAVYNLHKAWRNLLREIEDTMPAFILRYLKK